MKTLRYLVLGLLAVATVRVVAAQAPPGIAEALTPEIQALADGLQDDPVRIYNYVHDHIRYVVYFGSKKGAALTLLEKSGNDFDQCALLVSLLRAAGYTNTPEADRGVGCQFGWMLVPYDNPDHSDRDLHHWFGLSFTNTSWDYTWDYLDGLLKGWRFYPIMRSGGDNNTLGLQRVWVTLKLGGTNYLLDPAFKVSEPIAGISLPTAMGSTASGISNALMNAAAGGDFGNASTAFYATNLDEAAIRGALTGYTTNLVNYLQNNYPNSSVQQVVGGQYIVPSTNTALSQTLLFPTTNMDGTMGIISWTNQPTNMMSTLDLTFHGIDYKWLMPQLHGQRVSLTINSSGSAQLWQDDDLLASGSTGGGGGVSAMWLQGFHPGWHGGWNTTSNVFLPSSPYTDPNQQALGAYCQNANANYAILYSFDPDWGWLQARQRQLDAYRQQGLADTSREVTTETLNIMGLNWELQEEMLGRLLGQQIGALPQHAHRMGRMGQESGKGYYVDVYNDAVATCSSGGSVGRPGNDPLAQKWVDQDVYFSSAMESGMIEQLQASNLVAASTVKMLQLANTNHQAVYLASSANWASVQGQLTNYYASDLAYWIGYGYTLLLPQNGNNQIGGPGSWSGYGFLMRGAGAAWMMIGPGIYGGYASELGATINPGFVSYWGYSQPSYFSAAPPSLPSFTGADPVNMADGTFQVQETDLTLGQAEPRGLSFSRYYSSSRRNSNLAGMAPGWVHNYYLNAATLSAPQAGLGGTTPAQMAPMLAATAAAISVYNGAQPDPKNWLVTALVAKWGIDQLTAKAVSVTLGKDTLQFVKQPDGSYTPPANCTMTLAQNGSGYSLQERHGRTFNFNSSGWGSSIVDPYGRGLTLAYDSSNRVHTVTDWTNRTLTLTYTGTNLTSVADSANRSVGYGYGAGGDLTWVADPESKTNTFLYDTNHQITATLNALGQLVASNVYNAFGRVTTQYTQGDVNKRWKIFWSGWQTVEQDPAGSQRAFLYDDKTRLIAQQDALTNLSRTFYDGQDHVVMTVSPLNETNGFIFDGNHNLLAVIDPLGYSNQLFYDSQNRLYRSVDARGNPSTFGYNAHFSLTGATNGAGDWVTFDYSADGTLKARGEAGSVTTYGYDQWGQLNAITYTNGLGSESFVNSSLGDVTNHTNARGFVSSFQYNLRRQLTKTTGPTNLTASVSYDSVGNVQTATDARTNITTSFWSPTRHPTGMVFPATPQGTPAVTNLYDSRDWLVRSVDPLQKATLLTNDLASRLVSMTDPLLRTTRFGYDADGHQKAATNAAQEVTLQQWNAKGQMTQLTDPATHTVLSGYDGAGNQITLTNRRSKRWQFQFDAANRLTNTITPMQHATQLAYDSRGLLRTLREPSTQTTTNFYDARGRLTNVADAVSVRLYTYDANNNLTSITNAGQGSRLSWGYDAYDRVSAFTNAEGYVIQYRYDANGNLTNLVYPGGKNVFYAYDRLNRLTNVTDWAVRTTTITYDLASRVTSITRPNNTVRQLNYDADGEVTNIVEKTTTGYPIAFYTLGWADSGRVAWEFGAPLPHAYTPPYRRMAYNDDNQISTLNSTNTLGYDLDGNMTNGPLMNSALVSYGYDARNRLTNAAGVSYGYDPAGNRTSVTNGAGVTGFVVNPNAALPQVVMRVKPGVTNYYIYGAGLLYEITETAGSTNMLTYHFDYRGSTVALTDGTGMPTDGMEYSPYGMTTYRSGTNDTPFLYNGRYGVMTDPNGLIHMQARYYNPYLCRFINPDPAGFSGGLNWYCFVDGNPISNLDPFGLCSVGETGGSSWLPTWNGTAAVLIPGAASAQNAYSFFAQGNYANGAAAAVSSAGEAVLGGLMYANSAASSSIVKAGNWMSSLWEGGASAADTAGLVARAEEVHSALHPIAQQMRTTAVLETSGGRVVAGGGPDLIPAQRALLGAGETAARLPGAHAEVTALQHAAQNGVAPQAIGVTRAICPECEAAIKASGGTLTSPTTAVWPR